MLASRGFNREGLARVAEESNADISSANLVTETSNDAMSQEPFSSIKVESDAHPSVVNEDNDTTTTHQRKFSLWRVGIIFSLITNL